MSNKNESIFLKKKKKIMYITFKGYLDQETRVKKNVLKYSKNTIFFKSEIVWLK